MKKIDNEELEEVSGGIAYYSEEALQRYYTAQLTLQGKYDPKTQSLVTEQPTAPRLQTKMVCSSCGYTYYWGGDYVGQTFECPKCSKNTYTGVE